MVPTIPCVNIRSATSSVSDPSIASALDQALATHGFCYIQGHDVDASQFGRILEANHAFHALPEKQKQELAVNPFHRGYIGKDESQTVTSSVVPATQPNQSESFMVMQPVSADHPRWGSAVFGPNQWPDTLIPGFRATCLDYFDTMQRLAHELVQRLGVALGLGADAFSQWFTEPTIFLRLLHYPTYSASADHNQFGSAPHTDHGFLTLVAQDTAGGLEVKASERGWISVPPVDNTFVLNVADILSVISGKRWPSTPHRVVLNQSERYSAAFFYDPNFDAKLYPMLPTTTPSTKVMKIHYGDYLMERFDKNYHYRGDSGYHRQSALKN
jgi:isopenicillin N synthase-like dioxygenase